VTDLKEGELPRIRTPASKRNASAGKLKMQHSFNVKPLKRNISIASLSSSDPTPHSATLANKPLITTRYNGKMSSFAPEEMKRTFQPSEEGARMFQEITGMRNMKERRKVREAETAKKRLLPLERPVYLLPKPALAIHPNRILFN
jgi:hypothetical protein